MSQDFCHGLMYPAMKIHRDIHLHTQRFTNRRDTVHNGFYFIKGVNIMQFLCGVHFNGAIALFKLLHRLVLDVIGAVTTDPTIDLQLIAARAAKHLIYRYLIILSLDIPQCLVNAGDGAHHDRAAAIEAGAIHGLPQVFDFSRVLPNQVVGHLFYSGFDGVGMSLYHRLSPAADTLVCFNFEKQPPGLHGVKLQRSDLHRSSYLFTRPLASPFIRFSTSFTVTWLKSKGIECFKHEAAVANSMTLCGSRPLSRP